MREQKQYSLKTITTLSMAMGMVFATEASVADDADGDKFDRRFYLGGSIGATELKPRTSGTDYSVGDDKSSGGAVTFGVDLTPRFSVEGFYSELGEAGINNSTTGEYAGKVDYSMVGVSAIAYLNGQGNNRDPKGGLHQREGLLPYLRVGASKLDNSSDLPYRQVNDWNLHVGAGAEYGWSNGFAGRAEFTSYDKDVKMLSLGLVKRFGKNKAAPIVAAAAPVVAPAPVVKSAPLDIRSIHFDFDQATLTTQARKDIENLLSTLKADPSASVLIRGNTDSRGSKAYNQQLSLQRARTAKNYLINQGIEADRLSVVGLGELNPMTSNTTADGRAQNRRVDFVLQ